MKPEPTYVTVGEDGEPDPKETNRIMKQSLEPKTPLQIKLLAINPGTKRFASTTLRTRWRKLEVKGVTPDARLRIAWLEHCIEWGKKKKGMPYTSVISYAENKEAERLWIMGNRDRVLKKKSVGEIGAVLEAKERELDELHNEEE